VIAKPISEAGLHPRPDDRLPACCSKPALGGPAPKAGCAVRQGVCGSRRRREWNSYSTLTAQAAVRPNFDPDSPAGRRALPQTGAALQTAREWLNPVQLRAHRPVESKASTGTNPKAANDSASPEAKPHNSTSKRAANRRIRNGMPDYDDWESTAPEPLPHEPGRLGRQKTCAE